MTIEPINKIFNFNREAGFLNVPYEMNRESAYPIEEMLETYDVAYIAHMLHSSHDAKSVSRAIIANSLPLDNAKEVDLLDKHLDAIIFSFGSVFKLGLTPAQALKAIDVVMNANMSKLSAGADSDGKQMKPKCFIGPEEQLQLILDERNPNEKKLSIS